MVFCGLIGSRQLNGAQIFHHIHAYLSCCLDAAALEYVGSSYETLSSAAHSSRSTRYAVGTTGGCSRSRWRTHWEMQLCTTGQQLQRRGRREKPLCVHYPQERLRRRRFIHGKKGRQILWLCRRTPGTETGPKQCASYGFCIRYSSSSSDGLMDTSTVPVRMAAYCWWTTYPPCHLPAN